MLVSGFDYCLPPELIAKSPLSRRDESRLLYLPSDSETFLESRFNQLIDYLNPGDLLVLNDTRVLPARLFASKETGGKVEVLLERVLEPYLIKAQLKANKPLKLGTRLHLKEGIELSVIKQDQGLYVLALTPKTIDAQALFETYGHTPIPPYFERAALDSDRHSYQTVYARRLGAVAAPTAGLHFTEELLQQLAEAEIEQVFITLHIGLGTFRLVRSQEVTQHKMHTEWCAVGQSTIDQINKTHAAGGRVVAVGTTVLRALETTASQVYQSGLSPFEGETTIFIYPGFQFKVVDSLITNFHFPKSTLLMLVCAFGGYEKILSAYQYAIQNCFRFYSYGDAMLVEKVTQ